MTPGFDDDPATITDARKTAVINEELLKLNVDIAALQETRLASDGTLREKDYTFFWQGKNPEEPRIHGVGFAVKNRLLPSITPPTGGSERLLSLQLLTSSGPLKLICAYAPTLLASDEEKSLFYDELNTTIAATPPSDGLFILGDFNARVGADFDAWPSNIGHFGIGSLSIGKAPGPDGIPPEVIKAGKGSSLIGHLHSLLNQCWEEKMVPQDMRDAKIITLYKNKGDRSDCNNYRGISLLAIVGKVFARVILSRLQILADRVYPESQCGFRAKRSTIDMVFSLMLQSQIHGAPGDNFCCSENRNSPTWAVPGYFWLKS